MLIFVFKCVHSMSTLKDDGLNFMLIRWIWRRTMNEWTGPSWRLCFCLWDSHLFGLVGLWVVRLLLHILYASMDNGWCPFPQPKVSDKAIPYCLIHFFCWLTCSLFFWSMPFIGECSRSLAWVGKHRGCRICFLLMIVWCYFKWIPTSLWVLIIFCLSVRGNMLAAEHV